MFPKTSSLQKKSKLFSVEKTPKQFKMPKNSFYIHNGTPPVGIDTTKLKRSSPRVVLDKPAFENLDKFLSSPVIIENASGSVKESGPLDISKDGESESSQNSDSASYKSYSSIDFRKNKSLAASIIGRRNMRDKSERTMEKYKDRNFPLPVSKKELKARTEKLLDIVPGILAGETYLAIYYNLATDQRKNSPHQEMSPRESFDLPWHKHIAGFYGLTRQSYISSLIQAKHGALLQKSRNKTVLYWSPDRFATYVLANEIIIRLVSEDMRISYEEAETILRKTSDFGSDIADNIELIDDLDFSERKI